MDSKQIMELVAQLAAIAAAYTTGGNVGAIVELANVAAKLNDMIHSIKENDPAAWQEIRANYGDALARFEASTPKGE